MLQGRIPTETIKAEANAMFNQMEETEVDEEVAKLVSWTEHLDFAKYRTDWGKTATTAGSDALLPSLQQSKLKASLPFL